MRFFWLSLVFLVVVSTNAFAWQCNVECICPDPDPNKHADQINAKLLNGQHAVLCPSTTWQIRNTVFFSPHHDNTYLYTYGNPRDNTRALLQAGSEFDIKDGTPLGRIIYGATWDTGPTACDYCQIRNIRVDCGRDQWGFIPGGASCVAMGGPSVGQIVDSVTISNPRNSACLAIEYGPPPLCEGVQVTNNWFGPAGYYSALGQWSDGIQLQCRNAVVFYNEITDTTDAGIALFGSAGADVHDNRITALTRQQITGISLGDIGDYSGVTVHNNIINGQSAYIQSGIGMGPHIGCGNFGSFNDAGQVYANTIQGWMGFGMLIDGVTNVAVANNLITTTNTGSVQTCDTGAVIPAQRCAVNLSHATGSFIQSTCNNYPSLHGAAGIQP